MKDAPRQQFRWAAHSSGTTTVRIRDYEPAGEYESPSPYALWDELRTAPDGLQLGDLLDGGPQGLWIFKCVGFEPAEWAQPAVPAPIPTDLPADNPA